MDNEERMKKLLQAICKPVTPSPGFKERLLRRLTQEVSRRGLPIPRRLWLKPVLWAPIAAFVALALIGYFVLVPLVLAPVAPPTSPPAPPPVTPPAPSPTPPVTPAPTPTPAPPLAVVSTGILEIRVTDAPAKREVSAINVTVANIEVHRAGEDGGWITVLEGSEDFDLKELLGVVEDLCSQEIPVGHYTQIRMDIENVEATVDGEPETVEVKLPSGKLKAVVPFEINEDKTTVITIDFDAEKSLVFTGEDKVIFKPVVKLIVTYED
jgi:hypothetical protein